MNMWYKPNFSELPSKSPFYSKLECLICRGLDQVDKVLLVAMFLEFGNKQIIGVKNFIFHIIKNLMNTRAKILSAYYIPNMIIFKIFNRINLYFGVTIVALDLKLLRK